MTKLLLTLSGLLIGLSVIGGISVGVAGIAYSIWLCILMLKGTIAISFFTVCKVVGCWILAPLFGWITFAVLLFFGGLIGHMIK